jgi:signal transduction histidine kinase
VINPGDRLVIEWNEMFAVGVGDQRSVSYGGLPPGNYRFHVLGVNLMGLPDGDEAWVDVSVPPPLWKQPWFILVLSVFLTAVVVGCGRYLVWQQMRREMARLKNQQALESERLRIAHDIHDDLGARVTQISLLSAMSLHDPNLSEKTRADFLQIKKLSRDLVSALYETVWAVNPECDNLDALGNFLCQMANQLCERTEFHCRLQVSDLPREIQISSQMRHNVILAVKEAIHNVLKHSHGSEVEMRIALNGDVLEIAIRDNGCGFAPGGGPAGSGLKNMKQRMDDIGCDCIIESRPGSGTTIRLRLVIKRNSA